MTPFVLTMALLVAAADGPKPQPISLRTLLQEMVEPDSLSPLAGRALEKIGVSPHAAALHREIMKMEGIFSEQFIFSVKPPE